jgi:hypothetical protein
LKEVQNMENRRYLLSITSSRGVTCNVAYYADTPDKNYRVYYCGSDTGLRYARLGNAARYIENRAYWWKRHDPDIAISMKYGTAADVPRRGSNA